MAEDIEICDQHSLDEHFYVAPGVVMVGCTKCPYWEQAEQSSEEVIVTYNE